MTNPVFWPMLYLISAAFFALLWRAGDKRYRHTAAILCVAALGSLAISALAAEVDGTTAFARVGYDLIVIMLLASFGSAGRALQGTILLIAMLVNGALCIDFGYATHVVLLGYGTIIASLTVLQMIVVIDGLLKPAMDYFSGLDLGLPSVSPVRYGWKQHLRNVGKRT
jgi:hypothetical protein